MSVPTLVGDLEDSVSNLSEQFKDFDCVVFTAGSGGGSGAEMTLAIDLDGAGRSIKAAEKAGVKRYIMVSASHSDDRDFWDKAEGMKPYYIAKHYADEALRHSQLDYTILRPVQLTDDAETGKIIASLDPSEVNEKIARADVASAIAFCLDEGRTIHKTIELSSGESTVKEAFRSITHGELEQA